MGTVMFENQEYKELKAFLKEGFDISIVQGDCGLYAVSCGHEIDLSKEVKEYIEIVYKEDGQICKEAIECLVNHCYIVNRREIEKNGSPKILGVDSTGCPKYSQWRLFIGFYKNTICRFDKSIFDDEEVPKSKYQKLVDIYISENTASKCKNRSIYSNYQLFREEARKIYLDNKKERIEGDPEEWGPDTF